MLTLPLWPTRTVRPRPPLPHRLSDLVGGDIGLHVGASYAQDYGDRVYKSPLVLLMNEAKQLGEKTGKGGCRGSGCGEGWVAFVALH